jgi:hypothetical protein
MIDVDNILSEDLYGQFVEYAETINKLDLAFFQKTNWNVSLKPNYVHTEAHTRQPDGQHVAHRYREDVDKALQDRIYQSLFAYVKELWPAYTRVGRALVGRDFRIGTIKAEFQVVNPQQVFHKHKHSTELNSSVYLWPNEAKGTVFYDPDLTVEWKPNSAMIFKNEWHSFQNDSEEDRRFTINTFIGAK